MNSKWPKVSLNSGLCMSQLSAYVCKKMSVVIIRRRIKINRKQSSVLTVNARSNGAAIKYWKQEAKGKKKK